MSTELAVSDYSQEKIELIKAMVAKDCTDLELELFLYTCKKTQLDPLARQIYAIKRGGKMSIQTGIDGYRVVADRTGKLAGISDYVYDIDDTEQKHPNKASVTVRKVIDGGSIADFTATARWGEYNAGGPMWTKMPYLMLGKCAEALALRKAFPADLSGVYTAEEMAQADNEQQREQVFAEVEKQKSVYTAPKALHIMDAAIPPELDWNYQSKTGILICRIVDATIKTKKNSDKQFVAVKINQSINGKDMAFYWHNSHRELLLNAIGKVVKMEVTEDAGKLVTIENVLEVDGQKVPQPINQPTLEKTMDAVYAPEFPKKNVVSKAEQDARWIGSDLDYDDENLRELLNICKGDWNDVRDHLKGEKKQRESEVKG